MTAVKAPVWWSTVASPAPTGPLLADQIPRHVDGPACACAQVREANQMVEEMMLLANVTVAGHILAHFAACALLRRHAVPPPRQFEPLLRAAAAAGIDIDTASSKVCSGCLSERDSIGEQTHSAC